MNRKALIGLIVYSLASTALNVLGGTGMVPPVTGSPAPVVAPCPPAQAVHP
jgi:hypothetical protein